MPVIIDFDYSWPLSNAGIRVDDPLRSQKFTYNLESQPSVESANLGLSSYW